jgi:glycosyltransferase involved in cell wall biosynthesis
MLTEAVVAVSGSDPKVSVCVVTYNHERFIEPCIRSLLAQETSFDFEVIVGNDASTDGTGEILATWARQDRRLRVITWPKNVGGTQNFLAVHNAARGKLVANVDGDDIAAPGKLARQVAFLDSNPSLVACGHRMEVINEAGKSSGASFPKHLSPTFGLGKLIRVGVPVMNSSIMYRKEFRDLKKTSGEVLDWYFMGDILKHGDAGYLSENYGYYRISSNSAVSTLSREKMSDIVLDNYIEGFREWPGMKKDFFARAVLMFMHRKSLGLSISPKLRWLLRQSVTPFAVGSFIDGAYWYLENRPALAR